MRWRLRFIAEPVAVVAGRLSAHLEGNRWISLYGSNIKGIAHVEPVVRHPMQPRKCQGDPFLISSGGSHAIS